MGIPIVRGGKFGKIVKYREMIWAVDMFVFGSVVLAM